MSLGHEFLGKFSLPYFFICKIPQRICSCILAELKCHCYEYLEVVYHINIVLLEFNRTWRGS